MTKQYIGSNEEFLVSVVLVTYNSAGTVLETLDSIYEQSYRNLELIVADDASKDNTLNIVKNWVSTKVSRFKNIKFVETEENKGVVHNCNRGVKHATGEYVQLIAGDDILLPSAIELKIKASIKYPNKIIITRVELFGDKTGCLRMNNFCERGYKILALSAKEKYKHMLIDNYIAGPSWGFLKRSIYDEVGYYDERYPMVEDYPFLIKLMRNGYELMFINATTALYRIGSGSLCQSPGVTSFRDSMNKFYREEKSLYLIENKMYFENIICKISYFRYYLLKKYGSKSLIYKLSVFLYLINPQKFLTLIYSKFR